MMERPSSIIKMVAFDLMGVLFTEPHIISNLLFPMLPEPKDYFLVKEQYNLYVVGRISHEEFWKGVLRKKDYVIFEKEYLNLLKLDEDFDDVIGYLKQKYKLGIISNLPHEWGEYLIKKHRLDQTFNPIIISGKVKVKKPDLEIYRIFQRESKIPFNEIIFIDDRKLALKSAKSLGMRSVWFSKEDNGFNFTPDYTIRRLSELKEIL